MRRCHVLNLNTGERKTTTFYTTLHTNNPKIQFMMEVAKDNQLPFLDICMYVHCTEKLHVLYEPDGKRIRNYSTIRHNSDP